MACISFLLSQIGRRPAGHFLHSASSNSGNSVLGPRDTLLTLYSTALRDERSAARRQPGLSGSAGLSAHQRGALEDPQIVQASQALRTLNLLLRTHRLYNDS